MNQRDEHIIDGLKDTIREMESYIREEYCEDFEDFLQNDILKRAVAMCVICIDQMARGLSESFITANQHIMYSRFRAIRYVAERDYRSLDYFILWNAAVKEAPAFLNELLAAAGEGTERTSDISGYPFQKRAETRRERDASEAGTDSDFQQSALPEQGGLDALSEYAAKIAGILSQELAPEEDAVFAGQDVAREGRSFAVRQGLAQEDRRPAAQPWRTPKGEEAPDRLGSKPQFLNQLYQRRVYSQMMQTNMSEEQIDAETKKDVKGLLAILEQEKKLRGIH